MWAAPQPGSPILVSRRLIFRFSGWPTSLYSRLPNSRNAAFEPPTIFAPRVWGQKDRDSGERMGTFAASLRLEGWSLNGRAFCCTLNSYVK
jgi:hypothetical protein